MIEPSAMLVRHTTLDVVPVFLVPPSWVGSPEGIAECRAVAPGCDIRVMEAVGGLAIPLDSWLAGQRVPG